MADQPYVLGIDIGTGGARVLVIDQLDGSVVAAASSTYAVQRPQPTWSEQDPQDWWRGCCEAIREVLAGDVRASDIAAIGLSGQMHGLVALDANSEVLRPAILWNDQRTATQCQSMHDAVGQDQLIAITGKPAMTGFTAPKLLWMREHEADSYSRMRHVLLPKDYVRLQLTGVHAIDVADASGTSLLDLSTRDWSSEILSTLDVDPDILPAVHECSQVVGSVHAAAANDTGLAEGTPVIAGASDQAAAGVACGIADASVVSVNLGTSGVVFAARSEAPCDPSGGLHGYCHAIAEAWHVMGVMLSAGESLQWFRDALGQGEGYERIIEGAANIAPGCQGLSFLPYLSGERTPHADPNARGAFVGLCASHDRHHLARAVLEGVLLGLRDCLELVRSDGQAVDVVRMTGGGARSATWRQMAADVFGVPVCSVNVSDGSGYGAGLLAMVASGRFDSVPEAMAASVLEQDRLEPSADSATYEHVYEQWRGLYPALAPAFAEATIATSSSPT